MPAIIQRIIDGSAGKPIKVHLTDDSPIAYPLNLHAIREARFEGYNAQIFQTMNQGPMPGGAAFATLYGIFSNNSGRNDIRATAMFLTAEVETRELIFLLPLTGTRLDPLPQGDFVVTLQLMAFTIPG